MKSILGLLFLLSFGSVFSQQLVSSKLLPCNNYAEDIYRKRISSQRFGHDTLYLEIDFTHNCDVFLKPELKASGDSLFINLKDVSEIHAACDCCYSMLFVISEVKDSEYKLFVNKKEFRFSKSKYVDFPPLTISKNLLKNERNASGNKIGYWRIEGKNKNHHICFYGDGSSRNNEPLWTKSFSGKKLVSVSILVGEDGGHVYDKNRYERIMKEIEAEEQAIKY